MREEIGCLKYLFSNFFDGRPSDTFIIMFLKACNTGHHLPKSAAFISYFLLSKSPQKTFEEVRPSDRRNTIAFKVDQSEVSLPFEPSKSASPCRAPQRSSKLSQKPLKSKAETIFSPRKKKHIKISANQQLSKFTTVVPWGYIQV